MNMIESGLYTNVFEELDKKKQYESPEDVQALLKVMPKGVPKDLNSGTNFVASYIASMWDEGKILKIKVGNSQIKDYEITH